MCQKVGFNMKYSELFYDEKIDELEKLSETVGVVNLTTEQDLKRSRIYIDMLSIELDRIAKQE